MQDITHPLEWVAKAEGDYILAHSALRRKTPVTFGSCFHSQQSAEKYLKALLVTHGKRFPKIHDLLEISKICERAGILVPISEDALDNLTKYAVQTRYPGNDPTVQEAREALETAKAVRKFAREFLNVK